MEGVKIQKIKIMEIFHLQYPEGLYVMLCALNRANHPEIHFVERASILTLSL